MHKDWQNIPFHFPVTERHIWEGSEVNGVARICSLSAVFCRYAVQLTGTYFHNGPIWTALSPAAFLNLDNNFLREGHHDENRFRSVLFWLPRAPGWILFGAQKQGPNQMFTSSPVFCVNETKRTWQTFGVSNCRHNENGSTSRGHANITTGQVPWPLREES